MREPQKWQRWWHDGTMARWQGGMVARWQSGRKLQKDASAVASSSLAIWCGRNNKWVIRCRSCNAAYVCLCLGGERRDGMEAFMPHRATSPKKNLKMQFPSVSFCCHTTAEDSTERYRYTHATRGIPLSFYNTLTVEGKGVGEGWAVRSGVWGMRHEARGWLLL